MCSSTMQKLSWWHRWSYIPVHSSVCERFRRSLTSKHPADVQGKTSPQSQDIILLSSTLQIKLSIKRNKPELLQSPWAQSSILSVCTDVISRLVGQATKHKTCKHTALPINNSFSKPHQAGPTELMRTQHNTVTRREGGLWLPCPTEQNFSGNWHVEPSE